MENLFVNENFVFVEKAWRMLKKFWINEGEYSYGFFLQEMKIFWRNLWGDYVKIFLEIKRFYLLMMEYVEFMG